MAMVCILRGSSFICLFYLLFGIDGLGQVRTVSKELLSWPRSGVPRAAPAAEENSMEELEAHMTYDSCLRSLACCCTFSLFAPAVSCYPISLGGR